MEVSLARLLVTLLELYGVLGILFAVPFVWRGVERVDPAAHGSGWGFRLLILPGVVALWPLLLSRWREGRLPPTEDNAHRRAAQGGA